MCLPVRANSKPKNIPNHRLVDHFLLYASFIYLGIPNILFGITWIKPYYALVYTLTCFAGFYLLVKQIQKRSYPQVLQFKALKWDIKPFIFIAGALVLWMMFSGIGGVGHQNFDWKLSNSLLKHLVENDWPLILAPEREAQAPYFYVYYVGYYLPAALIGKLFGWMAANVALFIWSAAGVFLAISWFLRLLDLQTQSRIIWLVAPIFALFGGLDFIGWSLHYGKLPSIDQHIEWWAKYFQYSSNTTLLFWVPQHTIAAWILTGVLMFHAIFRFPPHSLALYFAFGILWSPFAIVGILPFIALTFFQWTREHGATDFFSISNTLLAPIVILISALYLASNTFDFPISLGWKGRPHFLLAYLAFLTLEVAVFFVPVLWLARSRTKIQTYTPWLWVSVAVLLMFPFVRMGWFNDIVMRGSIPALFVLLVFVAHGILTETSKSNTLVKIALIAVFCLGALTSGAEILRSIRNYQLPPPDEQQVQNILDLNRRDIAQRRGNPNSFFFRYLAKRK